MLHQSNELENPLHAIEAEDGLPHARMFVLCSFPWRGGELVRHAVKLARRGAKVLVLSYSKRTLHLQRLPKVPCPRNSTGNRRHVSQDSDAGPDS